MAVGTALPTADRQHGVQRESMNAKPYEVESPN
jgi:hypothetical protein